MKKIKNNPQPHYLDKLDSDGWMDDNVEVS